MNRRFSDILLSAHFRHWPHQGNDFCVQTWLALETGGTASPRTFLVICDDESTFPEEQTFSVFWYTDQRDDPYSDYTWNGLYPVALGVSAIEAIHLCQHLKEEPL